MKNKSGIIGYIIIKIIIVLLLLYFFKNPEIFATSGYDLAIQGIVVCRGMSLITAIYVLSGLLDTLINNSKG
ncbi:hypothetical protein [Anaerophilus nitritogenes]|uniref:hypothetical protein n=1 Tax=Anaerophilus nitritogenes TaxID=2498136 RepID=UPI00101CE28C|nr:hypothetical protein [Anaerophilus nitritogenes]